jgi:hypothetical protein
MTPGTSTAMSDHKKSDKPETKPRLSLAELLAKSMEEDAFVEPAKTEVERERWDDDEGSYSG